MQRGWGAGLSVQKISLDTLSFTEYNERYKKHNTMFYSEWRVL